MSVTVRARAYLALLAISAFAIPREVLAQGTGTIEGTVMDAGTKRPIANVQITIVGSGGRTGSVTNREGAFRILNVASGQREVRARLIGYTPIVKMVEVTAGGAATVALQMSQSAVELNAVVTTGTGGGQVENRKLGSTVASIEPPANASIGNLSEMLQGREAGVVVLPSSGTTGEGARIRIRGNASLSQSNEPIVYVDGVRIDNGGGFGSGVGTGGGGNPSRLDDIDPTSIEKVEVLKGAAAATLYGTEASNGVLLITTKKGQAGTPKWQFEIEEGMKSYPGSRVEPQWGFARSDTQATRLSTHYGQSVVAFKPFSKDVAIGLYETGKMTTVNGQVSGGTQLINYFASVRGAVEDGPFSASKFDWPNEKGIKSGVFMKDLNNRYQGTVSLGVSPATTFKVQTTALFSNVHQEVPDNGNSIYAPYTVALFSKPENAQCNASVQDGLAVATQGSMGNGLCAGPGNPTGASSFGSMRELLQQSIRQDARHFNGHVRTSYLPTSAFNLDATAGVDFTAQRSTYFIPFGNNIDRRINLANDGEKTVDDRTHQEITVSLNGGWNYDLPMRSTSNLIFGAQGFATRDYDEYADNQGFPGPGIEVVGGGSAPQVFESFSSIVNAGYFAQDQLGYHDWAFLTGGGRYDYNSAFGKTSGGVFYPQVSASVIFSDRESWRTSFMSRYLSTFRLRAAIGKAGRQPDAFAKLTTYSALNSPTGSGLVPSNLGNPNLKPEISTEREIGTEMGFADNRVSVGFTRWDRKTVDALYARQFPVTGGFRAAQLANIGELDAWGWDANVKSFVVNRPNISAEVFGNIGFINQLVKSLGGAPEAKVGGSYPRYRNFLKEGYAPSTFFGAKLPSACPSGSTSQFLPKQSTTPAAKTTGGVCLLPGQLPFDVNPKDGVPDTEAQLLAYLAGVRTLANVDPIAADDDNNGNTLDHINGKAIPDFEGSFGGSATIRRNWRVATNLEYRFGRYTISDLTGAFRRSNPTNGGNTKLRAETEAVMLNPASTAQQRLDATKTYAYVLRGLSPYDGLNQQFKGDWLRWRELSVTYLAPQTIASKAGAGSMEITFAARNFALFTKYPGVDPEVNVYSRRTGGGTDQNFGESVDAFGFPIPRQFSLKVRMGY